MISSAGLVSKDPIASITINTACPDCGRTLTYCDFTDGILESLGTEPSRWYCYFYPRVDKGCGKAFKTSEISKVIFFEGKNDD